MALAGDYYEELATSSIPFGTEMFDNLISHLTVDSFNQQSENVVSKLREALPIMVLRLYDNIISLKMVEEITKTVGITVVGHSNKRDDEVRLLFEAALVVLLYIGLKRNIYNKPSFSFYSNYEDLSLVYDRSVPGFDEAPTTPTTSTTATSGTGSTIIDTTERKKLVYFANFMKVVLLLVSNPKGKRTYLIDMITRISEDKYKKYITGSGQSYATIRRVQIYQKESGILPTPRPPRMKDIIQIILDDSLHGYEVTDNVVDYLKETNNRDHVVIKAYSFDHPTEAGVHVDTMEMLANDSKNVVTTISLSKNPGDNSQGYDISRSVSVATISTLSSLSGHSIQSGSHFNLSIPDENSTNMHNVNIKMENNDSSSYIMKSTGQTSQSASSSSSTYETHSHLSLTLPPSHYDPNQMIQEDDTKNEVYELFQDLKSDPISDGIEITTALSSVPDIGGVKHELSLSRIFNHDPNNLIDFDYHNIWKTKSLYRPTDSFKGNSFNPDELANSLHLTGKVFSFNEDHIFESSDIAGSPIFSFLTSFNKGDKDSSNGSSSIPTYSLSRPRAVSVDSEYHEETSESPSETHSSTTPGKSPGKRSMQESSHAKKTRPRRQIPVINNDVLDMLDFK